MKYIVKKQYNYKKNEVDLSGVYEAENLKNLCDKTGLNYSHLETLNYPDILLKIYKSVNCENYLIKMDLRR